MATIQFSHISKVYLSGTEAVKNFNMEVKDGELIVIAGSSGSGKSTILRMVAGNHGAGDDKRVPVIFTRRTALQPGRYHAEQVETGDTEAVSSVAGTVPVRYP